MRGIPFIGGGFLAEAILLVALALGYIVCYFARQEEKQFKILGVTIGMFIITLSLLLILGNLILGVSKCSMSKNVMLPLQYPAVRKSAPATPERIPDIPLPAQPTYKK